MRNMEWRRRRSAEGERENRREATKLKSLSLDKS
jgi:hypothetical protein